MANTDMPWGFKPMFMAEAQKTAMLFPLTNNYGTALFLNDPVVGVTTGSRIERAGTTGAILGVVLGLYKQGTPKTMAIERLTPVQYFSATPGTTYEYFALVAVDPNLFFIMQEDGAMDVNASFANTDILWTHTGNTTTGISKCEIDSSEIAVTATLSVKLIRPLYEWYDIDAGAFNAIGTNCKWVVKINAHQLASNIAGLA